MSLDNLSLSHADLRDLCKPLDDLADDIIDNAVDCASEMFSECMNKLEGNIIIMGILESLGARSNGFTYEVFHNNKDEVTGIIWMTSVM